MSQETQSRSRMEARGADPWLGVHVLTEFVFCPRAGLCMYETPEEDSGEEILPPSLDYMPRYDLRQIEDALEDVKRRLRERLLVAMGIGAATAVLAWIVDPEVVWLGMVGLVVVGWRLPALLKRAVILAWRQRRCLLAQPREPDPDSQEIQPVDWWELLHADFRSVPYKDSLVDENWRLAGRPWRVLRRGGQRIPVFRKRRGDARIRQQHLVRMVAYCHLLCVAEAAESPFGVVLFGDSYEGVAIPNSPGLRKVFHDALVEARSVVQRAQEGDKPSPPENQAQCGGCPLGKPFVYRPGITEYKLGHETLAPDTRFGEDGRCYHSHCGDRYGWIPRHKKAVDKGLRA